MTQPQIKKENFVTVTHKPSNPSTRSICAKDSCILSCMNKSKSTGSCKPKPEEASSLLPGITREARSTFTINSSNNAKHSQNSQNTIPRIDYLPYKESTF